MKKLITVKIESMNKIEIGDAPLFCDVSVTKLQYDNENKWYLFYTANILINGHRKFELCLAVSRVNYDDFHSQLRPTECSTQYRITKNSDRRCDIYEISTYAAVFSAICGLM